MRAPSSERLSVSEELATIISFVEGRIDAKEFERELQANPTGFEQVLNTDPGRPAGYLEQGVYRFLVQQNFNHFSDVLNALKELQNYLARNGITSDAAESYRKYFHFLLLGQPDWLAVVESDYFLKEILPEAGDRAGSELQWWVHEQLLERFRYIKKPPDWIQGPDWPINESGPLVFFGQVEVNSYLGDDAAAYVFYDDTNGECETVLQVA